MELQAPNLGEKTVFRWSPDMALYFHKYGLALSKGKLRYVQLLYEFDEVKGKPDERRQHSYIDTHASGYGTFCMPGHSVSLHPDLFMPMPRLVGKGTLFYRTRPNLFLDNLLTHLLNASGVAGQLAYTSSKGSISLVL